ncbi:MAG: hypothetical protein CK424_06115 [Legionella sp.]|nr:MAG: hypothetical protein CK424_06115 [Legionella sp.]
MSCHNNKWLNDLTRFLWFFKTKIRWIVASIFFVVLAYVFAGNLPFMLRKLAFLGILAPVGFLVLHCFASIFCLPGVLLVLAGGVLFGPMMGTILNVLGATLGAACGFSISRYLRPHTYRLPEHSRMQKWVMQIEHKGWQSVALLRLTPFIPYNLVNYSLGLTRIKFSTYLIATMIFITPNKALVTCCGYYGVTMFDGARVQHFLQHIFQRGT